ncbi:hypothetical protein JG687_00013650 [Phytophthora cactorum]|uniref:Uncharacterized protein n=1 Tax=Phytophthora cactorum TaxID=29920 RepID=A0A8T1U0U3_9STRA|nr:hypothetical protein JG687_00013650 [Phytophthora cactorum]
MSSQLPPASNVHLQLRQTEETEFCTINEYGWIRTIAAARWCRACHRSSAISALSSWRASRIACRYAANMYSMVGRRKLSAHPSNYGYRPRRFLPDHTRGITSN